MSYYGLLPRSIELNCYLWPSLVTIFTPPELAMFKVKADKSSDL